MKKRTCKPFYGKREQRQEAWAANLLRKSLTSQTLGVVKAIRCEIGARILARRRAAGWSV